MYIKEIKINGFKSFADKTNIELGKYFTGIVGPNGSGKSNILDAIKWVLGEGAVKNLRTESMSDVIFNGSKNRENANSASVTIIFDNTDKTLPIDFNEVEIKRIVYKTGENEYFINKEKCRLKDITELLTDSFSSKESFNIIPQGKIDEILMSKPEGRRLIIDEAASVLKYKRRKEATLKKLALTHENIDRVDMIINELEERINPLKDEALKAKKYSECKNKLENLEVAVIAKDITNYSSLLQDNKLLKEKLEEELSETMKDNSKDNSVLEKYKLDIIKIDEKTNLLQIDITNKNNTLSSLKTKKELLKERSKYEKDNNEVKTNLIKSKEKELELKSTINKYNLEKDIISADLSKSEEALNILNNKLSKLKEEKDINNSKLNSLKREEYEYKNKIDVLDKSIKEMDKVPYAVRNILNNPSLDGIIDIIGNIVQTDEIYNIMLSVALNSSFNFVIVENENNAKDAIEYLKLKNLGRVTFFPLNVIKPKVVDYETLNILEKEEDFIGVAASLVKYDKKFYNIVMNQLGNIIVTRDIKSAIRISKLIKYKYRVISLTGELFNTGGSITGGNLKINNIVNDKNEIIKLENKLKNTLTLIKDLEEKSEELNEKEEIIKNEIYNKNVSIIGFRESLREKNNQIQSKEEEYNLVKDEVETLSKTNKIDDELDSIMLSYEKEENELNELLKELEILQKDKKDINDEIFNKENNLKKFNTSYNLLLKRINEIEISNTKSSMLLDNLLNYLNEEYSITYEKATTIELDIPEKEARSIISELKKEIKNIGNVNLSSIEEYDRINKRYTFLSSQKDDLIKSENDLLSIINDMDEVMKDEFIKTFDSINTEFNKVFKELFGGGEAHLKLTDPSNILETGIDIEAVPSGKRIKSISQLSGGERTLTAVSLLFAIMNLKNVPFAILDEIESALDEANVDRFGTYINKYKGKTQLLIITHKKKTMEYVDVLYGITMQESGVSKLVSVKLEEIK